MRKDDALVELAEIKKDLPHWPDEVIKPWLRRVSLAKKTSTGVEPGCGGRGGPDDRHFPKRLANLNIFRAFGRTSAPPAQRFAGVRQSGSIAPPLRPSEIPLSTTAPQRGTTIGRHPQAARQLRGPGRRAGRPHISKTFRVLKRAQAWARQMEVRRDRNKLPADPSDVIAILCDGMGNERVFPSARTRRRSIFQFNLGPASRAMRSGMLSRLVSTKAGSCSSRIQYDPSLGRTNPSRYCG
jgi:hypothetical protein